MEGNCMLTTGQLYHYLVSVSNKLKERGADKLANKVAFASKFASGSSSELFGEARIVLIELKNEHSGILAEDDELELIKMIDLVEDEFRRIGGA